MSLWRIYLSKKYFGRYYRTGFANIYLPSIYEYIQRFEEHRLRWFIFHLLRTFFHEELHLILFKAGKGGHASEKTLIGPASDELAMATLREWELFEIWLELFKDLQLEPNAPYSSSDDI